jgi:hypothetical protein
MVNAISNLFLIEDFQSSVGGLLFLAFLQPQINTFLDLVFTNAPVDVSVACADCNAGLLLRI